MKLAKNCVFGIVLTLASGLAALAAESGRVRQISVSGTVEAKTSPDRALWHIDLRDTDKNLQEAKRRNDARVKAVVALRDRLHLGEGDLETGSINVSREYERTSHGERGDFKHFVVSRSVVIRQRDLKRFDEFVNTLLASTDMEVSFQLESSRAREVRAETRLKSLQSAKEKAAAMAAAMGVKLGPVLTIDEHAPRENPWQNPMSNSNAAFMESAPNPDQQSETFVPGAIIIRVTVHVTFELQ